MFARTMKGKENFLFLPLNSTRNTGSAKYLFFGKCLKKLLNIFLNYFFYLKVQSFRLIMENNFIEIAASNGYGPIFKHIIDCV